MAYIVVWSSITRGCTQPRRDSQRAEVCERGASERKGMGSKAWHPLGSTVRDTSLVRLPSARMQRWLIIGSLALVLAPQATVPFGSAATRRGTEPRSFAISPQSVGALTIDTATYERALQQFGAIHPPAISATFPSGSCRLTYRAIGLALYFARLDTARSAGTPVTCSFFSPRPSPPRPGIRRTVSR